MRVRNRVTFFSSIALFVVGLLVLGGAVTVLSQAKSGEIPFSSGAVGLLWLAVAIMAIPWGISLFSRSFRKAGISTILPMGYKENTKSWLFPW